MLCDSWVDEDDRCSLAEGREIYLVTVDTGVCCWNMEASSCVAFAEMDLLGWPCG